jgi:hypothetical protein
MLPVIKEVALELASYKGISTEKFYLYYYFEQPGLLRPHSSYASYIPSKTNSCFTHTYCRTLRSRQCDPRCSECANNC